jgi:sec-independent protein translocase protein TatA
MGLSVWHLLIITLVALVVFGGSGRISSLMGDMAKGIKSFRKGLSDDDDEKRGPSKAIDYTGDKSTMRERPLQDDLSTQAPPAVRLAPAQITLDRAGGNANWTSHV